MAEALIVNICLTPATGRTIEPQPLPGSAAKQLAPHGKACYQMEEAAEPILFLQAPLCCHSLHSLNLLMFTLNPTRRR